MGAPRVAAQSSPGARPGHNTPCNCQEILFLPQARCGGACGGAPQSGVLNACGGLFWDSGEDLHVGTALDNYVSFTAQLTWQAPVRWPPCGPPAAPHAAIALWNDWDFSVWLLPGRRNLEGASM